ncbi:hypothetical protein SDJN03_28527, partial [Cucurbita argyrosperma subsp. sororia]
MCELKIGSQQISIFDLRNLVAVEGDFVASASTVLQLRLLSHHHTAVSDAPPPSPPLILSITTLPTTNIPVLLPLLAHVFASAIFVLTAATFYSINLPVYHHIAASSSAPPPSTSNSAPPQFNINLCTSAFNINLCTSGFNIQPLQPPRLQHQTPSSTSPPQDQPLHHHYNCPLTHHLHQTENHLKLSPPSHKASPPPPLIIVSHPPRIYSTIVSPPSSVPFYHLLLLHVSDPGSPTNSSGVEEVLLLPSTSITPERPIPIINAPDAFFLRAHSLANVVGSRTDSDFKYAVIRRRWSR